MNRRDFLHNMGAAATMAAIVPLKLPELLTEPAALKGLSSVRFIRAYDVIQSVMVNRIDVLWGPLGTHLEMPHAIEAGNVLNASEDKPLTGAVVREWLETQVATWMPPNRGYDKLVCEAVSSCIKGKDGIVHRSWEITEHWSEQPRG